MIRIKVPATSANLSVGFDTLGISFELYNEFEFVKSKEDDVSSFPKEYQSNNLILSAYKAYFDKYDLEYIPVKIKEVNIDIPTARGLGSSATCIVAGVMAAHVLSGQKMPSEAVKDLVIELEGHPDNVIPALLGGLIASFEVDGKYECIKYEVNANLNFYALIPDFELKTSESRSVLPNVYSRKDIISNLGRIANLPYAFKVGDVSLLKKIFNDKIHEPYRYEIIKDANKVKEFFKDLNVALAISGAGPTILVVTDDESLITKEEYFGYKVIKLNPDSKGVEVYEI